MTVLDALSKHFRFARGNDNLPILAKPRTGRDMGRIELAHALGTLGYNSGVEVGVGQGYSAKLWCEAIPGLKLIGIDPYIGGRHQKRYYDNAQQNAEQYGFTIWKMQSLEAVDRIKDASVDFVHIDGDHTFDVCMQDIIRYTPKVRKGGLVLVHDYCAFGMGGVMKAVDAYMHCHRIDPWYVTRDCNPTAFWERGAERA